MKDLAFNSIPTVSGEISDLSTIGNRVLKVKVWIRVGTRSELQPRARSCDAVDTIRKVYTCLSAYIHFCGSGRRVVECGRVKAPR